MASIDLEAGAFLHSADCEQSWEFLENYSLVKHRIIDKKIQSNQSKTRLIRSQTNQKGRFAIAPKNILPGETLLSVPGVVVVNYKYIHKVCGYCYEAFTNKTIISKCSQCDEILFCKECSEHGVEGHEKLCGPLSTLSQVISQFPFELDHDAARLALHILIQSRNDFTSNNEFKLPLSLITHRTLIEDKLCKAALAGGAVLLKLLDMDEEGDKISESMAAELLLQIRFNAHSSDSLSQNTKEKRLVNSHKNALLGLFPQAATLNHSCRPNTVPIWRTQSRSLDNRIASESYEHIKGGGVTLELRSTCQIKQGDEITFSYISDQLLQGFSTRRDLLNNAFLFKCECPRCIEEELENDAAHLRNKVSKLDQSERVQARASITSAMQQLTMKSANNRQAEHKLDDALLFHLIKIISNDNYIYSKSVIDSELFSDACGCVMLSKDERALNITFKSLNLRWVFIGFPISLLRAEVLLLSVVSFNRSISQKQGKRDEGVKLKPLLVGEDMDEENGEVREAMLEAYSIYCTIWGRDHAVSKNLLDNMRQSELFYST